MASAAEKQSLVGPAAASLSAAQAVQSALNALVPDGGVPVPAQTIDSFGVTPTSVVAGGSVTVTWSTSNATAVRLNGASVALSGSQSFTLSANASYSLEADGSVPTMTSGPLAVTVMQPSQNPLASLPQGKIRAFGDFSDGSSISRAHHEYGSFAYDKIGKRMLMFGGGHSIPLGPSDVLGWSCADFKTPFPSLYPGTPAAERVTSNVDLDHHRYISTNQQIATHTWLSAIVTRNRYYLLSPGGVGMYIAAGGSPHGASYLDLSDMTWHWLDQITPPLSPSVCTATACPYYYVSSACEDPISGKVLILSSDTSYASHWYVFDPDANTLTSGGPLTQYGAASWVPDLRYHAPSDTFIAIQPTFTTASGGVLHPAVVAEFKFNRSNYSQSTYKVIPTTGTPPQSLAAGATPPTRWPYVPELDVFSGSVVNGKYYNLAYNPAAHSGVWSEHVLTFEDGNSAASVLCDYAIMDFDPDSGCVLFTGTNFIAYAYRP